VIFFTCYEATEDNVHIWRNVPKGCYLTMQFFWDVNTVFLGA